MRGRGIRETILLLCVCVFCKVPRGAYPECCRDVEAQKKVRLRTRNLFKIVGGGASDLGHTDFALRLEGDRIREQGDSKIHVKIARACDDIEMQFGIQRIPREAFRILGLWITA